jgi:hypothetical protein
MDFCSQHDSMLNHQNVYEYTISMTRLSGFPSVGLCPLPSGVKWYLERIHRQKQKTDRLKRDQLFDRKKSHLSVENKLLTHKAVIKPIWKYGIELWGCASKSNIIIMQRPQSKMLRAIANAPFYVTNLREYTVCTFIFSHFGWLSYLFTPLQTKGRLLYLTLRLLMSYIYIYIYGAPILDVSRSHTTTQHSR